MKHVFSSKLGPLGQSFFFRTLVYEFAHQQYFRKFAHHDQIRTPAEKCTKNSYDKQITEIDEQQGEVVKCSTAIPSSYEKLNSCKEMFKFSLSIIVTSNPHLWIVPSNPELNFKFLEFCSRIWMTDFKQFHAVFHISLNPPHHPAPPRGLSWHMNCDFKSSFMIDVFKSSMVL